jgi:hypothetical protein
MPISLIRKPSRAAKVPLFDPRTREAIGALMIAGPDHEATKAWQRDIADRRQRRGHRPDTEKEAIEALCARTVGWEGVKDTETGEEAPFDASALPGLYAQDWLMSQVLAAIGEDDFFFRE